MFRQTTKYMFIITFRHGYNFVLTQIAVALPTGLTGDISASNRD